jgi:hypothetical protein
MSQVEMAADGRQMVALVDNSQSQMLACNVLLLLMDHCDGSLPYTKLAELYQQTFGAPLSVDQLSSDLRGIVQVV